MGRAAALAIDIGTTSTKALALNPSGEVLADASCGYELHVPERGAAELDPDEVRRAALAAAARCSHEAGAEIRCVSFSSAMHSVIALDDDDRPLTACLTYADERSAPQAAELRSKHPDLYARTGTPLYGMSPISKIRWLAETRPQVFDLARRFISIKEYVYAAVADEAVTDSSSASGTGLMALEKRAWDPRALAAAGIGVEQLSTIVEPDAVTRVSASGAEALGLPPDTRVVAGAGDGPLANLGTGVRSPELLSVTVGTSGAVRSTVPEIRTDPNERLFCYVLGRGDWCVGGPINNGGVVMRWLGDLLFGEDFETGRLDQLAKAAPVASKGLVLLPFLTGERAPLWDADARAVMFGLGLEHGREELARAAMEGVAYALKTVADLVRDLTGPAREVRAGGGFVHSEIWTQIVADVMALPVRVADSPDSSTVGAALLGLAAVGDVDLQDVEGSWFGRGKTYEPDEANSQLYAEMVDLYRDLCIDLEEAFVVSAGLQSPQTHEAAREDAT